MRVNSELADFCNLYEKHNLILNPKNQKCGGLANIIVAVREHIKRNVDITLKDSQKLEVVESIKSHTFVMDFWSKV